MTPMRRLLETATAFCYHPLQPMSAPVCLEFVSIEPVFGGPGLADSRPRYCEAYEGGSQSLNT